MVKTTDEDKAFARLQLGFIEFAKEANYIRGGLLGPYVGNIPLLDMFWNIVNSEKWSIVEKYYLVEYIYNSFYIMQGIELTKEEIIEYRKEKFSFWHEMIYTTIDAQQSREGKMNKIREHIRNVKQNVYYTIDDETEKIEKHVPGEYDLKLDFLNTQFEYYKNIIEENSVSGKPKKEINPQLRLSDIMEESDYAKFLEILIDKGFIEKGTENWKDNSSGRLTTIISIFIDLENKGWFKNKRKLIAKEVCIIIENTFGIDISVDWVYKKRREQITFDFIPTLSIKKAN